MLGKFLGWAEYIGSPTNVIVGWATAHPAPWVPAPLRQLTELKQRTKHTTCMAAFERRRRPLLASFRMTAIVNLID